MAEIDLAERDVARDVAAWDVSTAQQAVNIVAPVMAGQKREDVETELRRWLDRHRARLPEPHYSAVVDAVVAGNVIVTLDPA